MLAYGVREHNKSSQTIKKRGKKGKKKKKKKGGKGQKKNNYIIPTRVYNRLLLQLVVYLKLNHLNRNDRVASIHSPMMGKIYGTWYMVHGTWYMG